MKNKTFLVKTVSVAILAALGSATMLVGCSSNDGTISATKTQQQPGQTIQISRNDTRQYQSITLPNQLQVVLVSDPTAEKSSAALSVDVGWLNDPASQQGLAHFLEHMLFMGTSRYPDPDGYGTFMRQHGGTTNAFTNQLTNYMFEINHNHYEEALDRFADFFKAPILLPDYVDKERHAVHSEWSMMQNQDGWAQRSLSAQLLGAHPANQFWIGNLDSLSDKEGSKLHDELVAFYQRYYSANRMKLVLISSDPLPQMQLLAKRYFADIENKQLATPRPTVQLDFTKRQPQRVHYVPNTEMQLLKLEFTIDNNLTDFASKPNEYLAHLLNSEMPGTPAQQLKAMGLLDMLAVDYDPKWYGNYGQLNITAVLTEAGMQQREAITAILMQYIALIREQGVSEKYYQEIRTSLQNQFNFLEKTDGFNYAAKLSAAMQYYPVQSVVSAPFQYDQFDASAISSLLGQLVPERLTVWHISQGEPATESLQYFTGKYSVAEINQQELTAWQQPLIPLALPGLNRFQPESFAIKHSAFTQPTQIIKQDAVEAWLMGSSHFADQPRGQLLMQWHQPTAKQTAKETVMHGLWQLAFLLNHQALWQEASAAGMQIQPEADEYDFVLKLTGFTDKQAALVSQIAEIIATPLTAQQFSQNMDLLQRSLRSVEQQMQFQQAGELLKAALFSGRFELAEVLAAAQQITLEELNSYIKQTLAKSQLRLLAQGNYNEADATNLAKILAGTAGINRDYQLFKTWQPQSGQRLSVMRNNPQADNTIFRLQLLPNGDYAGKAAAKVLSGHLHQAFFNQLRTEEQLGYVVQAMDMPLNEHAGFMLVIQSPALSAQQLQLRVDSFLQEYAKQLAALNEDGFIQLKQAQLLELQRAPANLDEEFKATSNDWLRNRLAFNNKQQLIAAVQALTLADMQQFYQQAALSEQAATLQVTLQGQGKAQDFKPLPGFTAVADVSVLTANH